MCLYIFCANLKIGWIIAVAGSIAYDLSDSRTSGFPIFTWWGLAFMFFVIAGVIYVIGADQVHPYRLAVSVFLFFGASFIDGTRAPNIRPQANFSCWHFLP